MVRSKKQILSPSEIQALRSEKNDQERMLKELDSENWGAGTNASQRVDKDALRRQVRQLDKAITDGTPRQIRGATKDKMSKRVKELEGNIVQGMPSHNEMWNLKRNPGAPTKNLNWQKRNAKNIQEYKQIMRQLEPGDPTASNIERLRRD